MTKKRKIVIKEANLINECPVCLNQELKLTFYQKHTYNLLFHRTTEEMTHKIKCKKCHSIIYSANWTTDIERVFEYYNKLVRADRPSVRFTTLFFMLLVLVLCCIAAFVYFYLEGFI